MGIRAAAIAVALLLVLAAEAAGQTERRSLLGTIWSSSATEIAKLDPLTLQPVSRTVRASEPSWVIAQSPAGDRAALTIGRYQDRLRFLDLRRMRFTGGLRLPGVITTLWRDARRLVVVAGGDPTGIFVVDPVRRKARRAEYLDGHVVQIARRADGLVLLLAPLGHIGTARLAVIDSRGRAREVSLAGVRAGTDVIDQSRYVMRQETPGLAVEPSGRRAVIVPAVGNVTEINLQTLAVEKKRTLAAQGKVLEGWRRSAVWFGDLIAVTGSDSAGDKLRPAGVTLIDTRDWTQRHVEPEAWSAVVAGNTLLVCGSGLGGYASDGTKRFHVLGTEDVPYVQVLGSYVYVAAENNTRYTIVDPATGQVVKRVTTTNSTTLANG